MNNRVSDGSPLEVLAGYSRAVRVGTRIAVSGTTADIVAGEPLDTYQQTSQSLRRALAAAAQLGGTTGGTLRTRVFLVPSADWEAAARAHAEVFGAHRPANTMVFVTALIGDEGALVEVEIDVEVEMNAGATS